MAHARSSNFVVLFAALGALACGRTDQNAAGSPPSPSAGTGSAVGGAGAATGGSASFSSPHGVVQMYPLRGVEYTNSIRELTGVETRPPLDYDNRPFYLGSIDHVEPWLDTATVVAAALFKPATLPPELACADAPDSGRGCAESFVDDFGLRAFRRPLREAERQAYLEVYDDIRGLGESARGALEQVVIAILVSPQFTYHLELSDDPEGRGPEPLDSFALAARLSFALWSTTPDRELLAVAADGLTEPAVLRREFARLMADERRATIADGLTDVWLNLFALRSDAFDAQVFPSWNNQLRDSIEAEQLAFMRLFTSASRPLRELLTLDVNFVDDRLAELYGFAPVGAAPVQVSRTDDARTGLLGLAGFLARTSGPARSSPIRRGSYILGKLLCSPPDPPPESQPDGPDTMLPENATIRQRVEADTNRPLCQQCHESMDQLGFALGHFDAIGRYIDTEQGSPIDASATLPSKLFPPGTHVDGLLDLARAVEANPWFHGCAARNLAELLVRREMTNETDSDLLQPLTDSVTASRSLPHLAEQIVLSDAFRYRRQPASP